MHCAHSVTPVPVRAYCGVFTSAPVVLEECAPFILHVVQSLFCGRNMTRERM